MSYEKMRVEIPPLADRNCLERLDETTQYNFGVWLRWLKADVKFISYRVSLSN